MITLGKRGDFAALLVVPDDIIGAVDALGIVHGLFQRFALDHPVYSGPYIFPICLKYETDYFGQIWILRKVWRSEKYMHMTVRNYMSV